MARPDPSDLMAYFDARLVLTVRQRTGLPFPATGIPDNLTELDVAALADRLRASWSGDGVVSIDDSDDEPVVVDEWDDTWEGVEGLIAYLDRKAEASAARIAELALRHIVAAFTKPEGTE